MLDQKSRGRDSLGRRRRVSRRPLPPQALSRLHFLQGLGHTRLESAFLSIAAVDVQEVAVTDAQQAQAA